MFDTIIAAQTFIIHHIYIVAIIAAVVYGYDHWTAKKN